MKKRYFCIVAAGVLFMSCAGTSGNGAPNASDVTALRNELAQANCPAESDLRGEGVGANASEALSLAQAEIARQIHSSVQAANTSLKRSERSEGKETITASYSMQSEVSAKLENAEDARLVKSSSIAGAAGAVACMSRVDAAKPYQVQKSQKSDSLNRSLLSYFEQTNPKEKIRLASEIETQYYALDFACKVLSSLIGSTSIQSDLESSYASFQKDFAEWKSNLKFYFIDQEFEDPRLKTLETSVFAELSKRLPMELTKERHENGVHFVMQGSVSCGKGSFGPSCKVPLVLRGESAEGDSYFMLEQTFKGSGRHDENEAMNNLYGNVNEKSLNAWIAELEKWK